MALYKTKPTRTCYWSVFNPVTFSIPMARVGGRKLKKYRNVAYQCWYKSEYGFNKVVSMALSINISDDRQIYEIRGRRVDDENYSPIDPVLLKDIWTMYSIPVLEYKLVIEDGRLFIVHDGPTYRPVTMRNIWKLLIGQFFMDFIDILAVAIMYPGALKSYNDFNRLVDAAMTIKENRISRHGDLGPYRQSFIDCVNEYRSRLKELEDEHVKSCEDAADALNSLLDKYGIDMTANEKGFDLCITK